MKRLWKRQVRKRNQTPGEAPSGERVSAERFHNIPGVKIRDLLDAGAHFEPDSGQWIFSDGSRGQFATMQRNGGVTDIVFVTVRRH